MRPGIITNLNFVSLISMLKTVVLQYTILVSFSGSTSSQKYSASLPVLCHTVNSFLMPSILSHLFSNVHSCNIYVFSRGKRLPSKSKSPWNRYFNAYPIPISALQHPIQVDQNGHEIFRNCYWAEKEKSRTRKVQKKISTEMRERRAKNGEVTVSLRERENKTQARESRQRGREGITSVRKQEEKSQPLNDISRTDSAYCLYANMGTTFRQMKDLKNRDLRSVGKHVGSMGMAHTRQVDKEHKDRFTLKSLGQRSLPMAYSG